MKIEAFLLFIVFCFFYIIIKNIHTYNIRGKIFEAIDAYNDNSNLDKISYKNIEAYEKTLYRFWDWGTKRIVDEHTYTKIKDYIK